MDVDEAFEKASRILEEERRLPTIGYGYVSNIWPNNMLYQQDLKNQGYSAAMAAQVGLGNERKIRPRNVYEDPKLYKFTGVNFDLLVKIFQQLPQESRKQLIDRLLDSVRNPVPAFEHKWNAPEPSYDSQTSSLSLLAEFCIRAGYLDAFLEATKKPKLPTASLVIMLREIEDMVALNFNLFSDSELEMMPTALMQLREIGERQTYTGRGTRGGPIKTNPHYQNGYSDLGKEVVSSIDDIIEECRKARYWYLKGALQELPNLELDNDKLQVESYLKKLGFDDLMVKSLNKAEEEYRNATDGFDLKDCLDHVRSFFEQLHRQAANAIADKIGNARPAKYGDAIAFLQTEGFFTEKHEKFAAALFGFFQR